MIRGGGKALAIPVVAIAIMAGACAPSPAAVTATASPGVPGAQASTATAQADGMLVTLAISSDTIVAGERVSIRISALNAGLGPAAYSAGGCGPIMNVGVVGPPVATRPVGNPPQGDDPKAILELARWSALSQGGLQLDAVRTTGVPDDGFMACTADLRYEDLGPGETFSDDGTWIARIADGAPAAAGHYTVVFDFPFAGRVAKEDVREDAVVRLIRVSLPVTVLPGPAVTVDAEAAIDAAIADARVLQWAARSLTRESLSGATITMVDGRWRWRITHAGGQVDVYVDPVSGQVVETRL